MLSTRNLRPRREEVEHFHIDYPACPLRGCKIDYKHEHTFGPRKV